jgi:exonuclease III
LEIHNGPVRQGSKSPAAAKVMVCLQELKAPQENFPITDIRKAGYGAVWHGQKAWNGVAILALGTDPIETRRGLPGDPDDLTRGTNAAMSVISSNPTHV